MRDQENESRSNIGSVGDGGDGKQDNGNGTNDDSSGRYEESKNVFL